MNSDRLEALLRGDEPAASDFVEEIRPQLTRAAVYFLGYQDPDVEDVVQDALAIAFKKLPTYDSARSSLKNWITHICVKLCFQRLRKRQRHLLSQADELEGLMLQASLQAGAEAESGEDEAKLALLRQELARLEGRCAEILKLRHLEGRSYAVIAELIKVPMGTVMSRLARCRDQLRIRILAKSRE